jgi:hypothetical protein
MGPQRLHQIREQGAVGAGVGEDQDNYVSATVTLPLM